MCWDVPGCAGRSWNVLGCAGRGWEMLCHAGRCWDSQAHARNSPSIGRSSSQKRAAVPTSLEFHETGITRAGLDGLPGITQETFIPFPQRHMKGFVFSSLERGRRFPSPFPAETDPTFPLRGAGCLHPPLPGQLGKTTGVTPELPDPTDGLIFLGRRKAGDNCGRRG